MDLFEFFEMRQALRVSVGHRVTAKDFVSANHKLEVERKLHEVAVLLWIHMIHFRRILTFFVLYVGPGLEPVFTLLIVGFLREKRWLHALNNSLVLVELTRLNKLFAFVKLQMMILILPRKSGAFRIRKANHCRFAELLESGRINTWNSWAFLRRIYSAFAHSKSMSKTTLTFSP